VWLVQRLFGHIEVDIGWNGVCNKISAECRCTSLCGKAHALLLFSPYSWTKLTEAAAGGRRPNAARSALSNEQPASLKRVLEALSQVLMLLRNELEAAIKFPLVLFKDYFSLDPLHTKDPVSRKLAYPNAGKNEWQVFHDAGSMAKELSRLFEYAINKWTEYQNAFGSEVVKLSEEDRLALFHHNRSARPVIVV
jgi:hypothetical protein